MSECRYTWIAVPLPGRVASGLRLTWQSDPLRCQLSPVMGPPVFGQDGPLVQVTLVESQAEKQVTIDTHQVAIVSGSTSSPAGKVP